MLQSGGVGNEADEITPEIQSLADGLRNDPLKIYEYVRNYIDYQCYYGSKKGAHLTLMEGSGNDMDQAALLVALLRAAGHSAGYTHGPAQFSFNEYVDWWGISPTPYTHMTNANFAAMLGLTDTSATNVARWKKRWAVIETARAAGVAVSFDTNLRLKLWPIDRAREVMTEALRRCDIALPSLDDVRAITGLDAPDDLVDHCLGLGARIVALKLGADGAIVASATERHRIAPHRCRPVDATGAGDTFGGAFVARWLAGDGLAQAGRYAAVAAALSTEGYGAVEPIPRTDAVLQALQPIRT
jgi:2-dehydro-3-deoxygluconokinase